MALWGRKEPATAPAVASNGQGGRSMTGLEQHEWRSSTWQGQNAGRAPQPVVEPLPPEPPPEDLVLTQDMAEPAPEPAPEPVVVETPAPQPEPEPAPVLAQTVVPVLPMETLPPEPVERTDDSGRSQFFAGRGVKIKAEVSGCDMFRVEGDFDGQVTARRMFISPTGVFKGTGTVEEAEVEGRIEGTLVVTGVLVLKATGRVTGSVSYGQIEIERGGHLQGDIKPKAVAEPVAARSRPAPEPVRVSAPEPVRVSAPRPTPEPTPVVAEPTPPRKTILPPLSFGAKKN